MSACFIQSVEDDLLDIADAVKREMRLFKFGSGTGTNFSKIRGEGEKLAGGGTSSGLMSFLEVLDRAAGATKWSPRQLTRFAVEGITAFSIQPLKFATKLGFLTALFAVGLGLFYLVRALLLGDPVPGFPTLIVVILMLGGMQLMAIGLLGEYLGRLWLESKQRPLFIVQDYWPARQFQTPPQDGP